MRIALVGLLGLSMLNLKGCDLTGGPEEIRTSFESNLRPYFANAKAVVDPQQQIILGFTCIDGAGPKMIEEAAEVIRTNPDIASLRDLRTVGKIFGNKFQSYRFVALAFDKTLLRLNVETWQLETLALPQGYDQLYRTTCGLSGASNTSADNRQNVYIAHISVAVQFPNGVNAHSNWTDSLGVWKNDEEFEQYRAQELAFVDSIIRQEMTRRGLTFISTQLVSIDKKPI